MAVLSIINLIIFFMKKVFVILLSLLLVNNLFADSWTDLTQEQAEKAVEHLQKNPYIFDYCDCCDMTTVRLIYVTDVYFLDSQNEPGLFEVHVVGKIINEFDIANVYGDESAVLGGFYKFEGDEEFSGILSVNYTFVYSHSADAEVYSVRLCDITGYDQDLTSCVTNMVYPHPSDSKAVDANYKKWYKTKK